MAKSSSSVWRRSLLNLLVGLCFIITIWHSGKLFPDLYSLYYRCVKRQETIKILLCVLLSQWLGVETGALHFLLGNKIENSKWLLQQIKCPEQHYASFHIVGRIETLAKFIIIVHANFSCLHPCGRLLEPAQGKEKKKGMINWTLPPHTPFNLQSVTRRKSFPAINREISSSIETGMCLKHRNQ